MPKTPKSTATNAREAAGKYLTEFRTIPGGILLCKSCEKEVSCEKTFNYKQHRSSQQHKQHLSAGAGSSSGNLSAMLTADHFHKYALLQTIPASDAIVERSFSKLKILVTSNRHFSDENVKGYVIGYINY